MIPEGHPFWLRFGHLTASPPTDSFTAAESTTSGFERDWTTDMAGDERGIYFVARGAIYKSALLKCD